MDALSKLALVGAPTEAVSEDPTAATVLAKFADASVERRILLAAGARAIARAAGYVPNTVAAPAAPSDDARATIPETIADAIGEMLDGYEDLLPETLARVGDRQLPPRLIPRALAVVDDELRRLLHPHLGARAKWVAAFEPTFGWLLRDADVPLEHLARTFDEGTTEAREEALIAARLVDPDAARTWVERSFPSEKADVRATFVAALETGLGPADEPFLERTLDDRGGQVREAARTLLAQLPSSAYVARMIARADLEPPREVSEAEIRDGLLPKATRAEWLERFVAAVPTSHWGEPRAFLARVEKSDYRDAILTGLVAATQTPARAPAWVDALFELVRRSSDEYAVLTLLEAMPVDRRAARLEEIVATPNAEISLAHALATMPSPWPESLSGNWLAAIERRAESAPSWGDPWVASLGVGARHVPFSVFAALREVLVRVAGEKVWKAAADDAFEVLRLRSVTYQEGLS